jgi:SAM-dependent methyltransferase
VKTLIILGRQPALGLAELESLYGPENLQPVGAEAVLLNVEPNDVGFSRLGSMVKFCKVLTPLDTTDWTAIHTFLENAVPEHAKQLPEGKLTLGLSVYGLKVSPKRIQATGLTLKKLVRASGRSVRLVPNTEVFLNSAQVLHNNLTRKLGWELVFVRDGNKTIVCQSIAVQDIDAYRKRDQERPARDARVGMLPPKLAQIIINLAVGNNEQTTILDPFCGTGVVLQEALLMGYTAFGTDLDPRMVQFTKTNLAWLSEQYPKRTFTWGAPVTADATSTTWKDAPHVVASETYLGRALNFLPDYETLNKIMSDCDTIHRKFLQNIARQTKPGFRMCIAVPAWKTKNGFKHLRSLDNLDELGYTRMSFVHAKNEDLIYHRPDQTVARELVVLIRK